MTSNWLHRALEESRARGHLGPGDLGRQLQHALGFATSWDSVRSEPPTSFLDLGSGGGLPGLVLLEKWDVPGVLVDSMYKRTEFLIESLEWEDAPSHGQVVTGRAEDVARMPEFEGHFELVTSRSFGPPSVTAECGVRFLSLGGLLIVSEPPRPVEATRWPVEHLKSLGLRSLGVPDLEYSFHILEKISLTTEEYPRRVGTPAKRPLF